MRELSLSILDLVQNSIRANATVIELVVQSDVLNNNLRLIIKDNGCGMTTETLSKIADPFFTGCAKHKVGLGIPLFKQRALLTNGSFAATSKVGEGTTITAVFNTDNVNFVPLGDMKAVLLCLIISYPAVNFIYSFNGAVDSFYFDTKLYFNSIGVDSSCPMPYKAKLIKEYLADKIIQ